MKNSSDIEKEGIQVNIMSIKEHPTRNSNLEVIFFFLFTLAWVWTVWIVPIFVTNSLLPYSALLYPAEIYLIIGAIAPSVIALLLIKFNRNMEILASLKSSIHIKFPIKWWVPLVLIFPLLYASSHIVVRVLFSFYEPYTKTSHNTIISLFEMLLFSITLAIGGEFGWRQYALNQLQTRFSPFCSSLIIGCCWSLFYFPLYLIDGILYPWWPFPFFLLLIISVSFLFTWIYYNTKSSLITVIILNIELNMFIQLLYTTNIVSGSSIPVFYIPLLLIPVDFSLIIVTSLSFIMIIILYFTWDSKEISEPGE